MPPHLASLLVQLNSAYHVHNVGAHLTNYLGLQAEEIDKLDTQVKVAQARLLLSKGMRIYGRIISVIFITTFSSFLIIIFRTESNISSS